MKRNKWLAFFLIFLVSCGSSDKEEKRQKKNSAEINLISALVDEMDLINLEIENIHEKVLVNKKNILISTNIQTKLETNSESEINRQKLDEIGRHIDEISRENDNLLKNNKIQIEDFRNLNKKYNELLKKYSQLMLEYKEKVKKQKEVINEQHKKERSRRAWREANK